MHSRLQQDRSSIMWFKPASESVMKHAGLALRKGQGHTMKMTQKLASLSLFVNKDMEVFKVTVTDMDSGESEEVPVFPPGYYTQESCLIKLKTLKTKVWSVAFHDLF